MGALQNPFDPKKLTISTLLGTRKEIAFSRYYEGSSIGQAFFRWLESFIGIATFAGDYICGRRGEKGFLKPLPVPDRFYSELSIDFITDLFAKEKEIYNS
jgi:hypothetical protein